MCKIDLSDPKIDLAEARALVEKNLDLYRADVVSLISNQEIVGIRFGRCFLHDKEIQKMLHDILENETLDFALRVQSLYEILMEPETPTDVKEIWLNYLLDNLDIFKNMCKRAYSLENKDTKDKYYQKLVHIKIPKTKVNKKWVYLIELAILYSGDEEIRNIIYRQIHDSVDSFLIHAGEKCLEYLKAE